MKFHLFMLPTIGRKQELERGMAGQRDDLCQRMLGEIDEQVRFADEQGYYGIGFILLDAYVGLRSHHPLKELVTGLESCGKSIATPVCRRLTLPKELHTTCIMTPG